MKRPSFQFYPGDWQSNLNLKRCSFRLKGIWLEIICLFHGSDEYGILRWTLQDIALAVGCQIEDLKKLIEYGILKGTDKDIDKVSFSESFSQRNNPPCIISLIDSYGPLWYSSRMVRDEYVRQKRAQGGIKSLENKNVPRKKNKEKNDDKDGNKDIDKDTFSRSFSPSPSSSSSSSYLKRNIHIENPGKIDKDTFSISPTVNFAQVFLLVNELACQIHSEYPVKGIQNLDLEIDLISKLLTLGDDKVGTYPQLRIEGSDAENIVRERAKILLSCVRNYKKYIKIRKIDDKFILLASNFFDGKMKWRFYFNEPKPIKSKPTHHDYQERELSQDEVQRIKLTDQYVDFLEEKIPLSREEILLDPNVGKEVSGLVEVSEDSSFWFRKFGFEIRRKRVKSLGLPTLDQWLQRRSDHEA